MYMQKFKVNKKKLCLCLAILSVLIFSLVVLGGCSNSANASENEPISLSNIETKPFLHDKNGLALTIPKAWKIVSNTDDSTVFANADKTITLTTAWEVGGMGYYSYKELEEAASNILNNSLSQVNILKQDVYSGVPNAIQVVATGVIGDEKNTAVADILIISPLSGIRYYLVTICGVDEYKENHILFGDIYNSFYVGKPEDFLFKQIESHRLVEEENKNDEKENAKENASDKKNETKQSQPQEKN